LDTWECGRRATVCDAFIVAMINVVYETVWM